MATLRSPTGSTIQATGRLQQRLLDAGWTVSDDPAAPGQRMVTAADIDNLAGTLSTAVAASVADRADLRSIVEPMAVEVDELGQTIEAVTTQAAPKPTPRMDALEAWRTQAEQAITQIQATVDAIDVPAQIAAWMAAHPAPTLHPVATSGDYADLLNRPTLGTMAAQGKSTVDITGGTIAGITDLAVGDGGTGASTPANARTNLGLKGAAILDVGTTAGTVAAGNDSRLSDARTPTAHTHPAAEVTGLHAVATSGDYASLANKPALAFDPAGSSATAQANAVQRANHTGTQAAGTITGLHAVATSGDYNALANKPAIPAALLSAKITSDQPFTATALANVTGLAVPVTNGTTTRFTFTLAFRAAAITTGIRLGLTTPAFTTFAATVSALFAADGSDAIFEGSLSTSGDSVLTTAVPATGTDYLAVVEGFILPSANGNVQLQAATEVASSAATVRAGSHVIYLAV